VTDSIRHGKTTIHHKTVSCLNFFDYYKFVLKTNIQEGEKMDENMNGTASGEAMSPNPEVSSLRMQNSLSCIIRIHYW